MTAQGHTVNCGVIIIRLPEHMRVWSGQWPWNQIARAKSCVTSCSFYDFGELWTISELQFPPFKNRRKSSPCHRRAPWKAYKAWHIVRAQMPLLVTLLAPSPVGHFQLHSHLSAVSYRYNSKGPFYWADIERKGLLDLFYPCPMSAQSSRSPGQSHWLGLTSPGRGFSWNRLTQGPKSMRRGRQIGL